MNRELVSPPSDQETIWTNAEDEALGRRSWLQAMTRGVRGQCPNCGARCLFATYLRIADACAVCGEELHHHRADDAPPYFTILIVGHLVVPLIMALELAYAPPVWLHLSIWLPLTALLCLLLLPRVKGAIVGLQWALRMHGFDHETQNDAIEDPSQVVKGIRSGPGVVNTQIAST